MSAPGAHSPGDERAGVAILLVGSVLISFSAVFVKIAHVGPTAAGVYRNLFGGLALLPLVVLRGEPLWRGGRPLIWATLAGVLFAVDIFCWHRSIVYIGPGLATIMGNFQVFALAAVGVAVFGEKVTWRFLVSIPLAFFGLFLLVGIEWGQLDPSYKAGVGFGLATAAAYAAYLLTMRYSQKAAVRLPATSNLFWVSLVTAAILAAVARGQGEDLRIPDTHSWVVLIAYGVLCQALGWVLISRALPRVDASRTGLLLLLQPTLTFIWDILFFARPTTAVEMVGALLALGAIYLGNTRRRGARAAPPRPPGSATLGS